MSPVFTFAEFSYLSRMAEHFGLTRTTFMQDTIIKRLLTSGYLYKHHTDRGHTYYPTAKANPYLGQRMAQITGEPFKGGSKKGGYGFTEYGVFFFMSSYCNVPPHQTKRLMTTLIELVAEANSSDVHVSQLLRSRIVTNKLTLPPEEKPLGDLPEQNIIDHFVDTEHKSDTEYQPALIQCVHCRENPVLMSVVEGEFAGRYHYVCSCMLQPSKEEALQAWNEHNQPVQPSYKSNTPVRFNPNLIIQ